MIFGEAGTYDQVPAFIFYKYRKWDYFLKKLNDLKAKKL